MRVIVIGGGVIGVTTAYYLAREGADVVVIERGDTLAGETSYATGGHIAPGHSGAWASPRALRQLGRSLYRRGTPYRLRIGADRQFLRWTWDFARNCTTQRYWRNTETKVRLSIYSRDRLIELRERTGIAYDQAMDGALFLYRSPTAFAAAVQRAGRSESFGLRLQVLTPEDIRQIDDRLAAVANQVSGGMFSPIDEIGDTRLFTLRLAEICREHGVEFRLGTSVVSLVRAGRRIAAALTGTGSVVGDVYVMANGVAAAGMAREVGIRLPVYPLRGYTVTLPARGDSIPTIGLVDEERLVAIARLGSRIRLGGVAELAARERAIDPTAATYLIDTARRFFPDGADWDQPALYPCRRPMTPDGPPVLGKTAYDNLFINAGHGHVGWTMACGSAVILADIIAGRVPAIDIDGMTLARFAA